MPTLDRTRLKNFTKAVKQKNQNFRTVLALMEEHGEVSAVSIQDYFKFKGITAARNLLRALVQAGLATQRQVSSSNPFANGMLYYKRTALADEADLDALFPLEADPHVVTGEPNTGAPKVYLHNSFNPDGPKSSKVTIQRDPLVAFIHGTGRAPSLNFTSQHQGG